MHERYRYTLTREVRRGDLFAPTSGTVLWIALNPSTAHSTDHERNDPTVRRMVRFTRDWGYAKMVLGNVYAARSTDPVYLAKMDDPIGPKNDRILFDLATEADIVIAAWGSHPAAIKRQDDIIDLVTGEAARDLYVIGTTKDGYPRHPLYVRAAARPVLWRARRTSMLDTSVSSSVCFPCLNY